MPQDWWLCYFALGLDLPYPVLCALKHNATHKVEQPLGIDLAKMRRQQLDWSTYWAEWEDTYAGTMHLNVY